MQYVCDAPKGKTWFRIETEGEAAHESRLMRNVPCGRPDTPPYIANIMA